MVFDDGLCSCMSHRNKDALKTLEGVCCVLIEDDRQQGCCGGHLSRCVLWATYFYDEWEVL